MKIIIALSCALVACSRRPSGSAAPTAAIARAPVRVRGVAASRARVEGVATLLGRLEPYERAALAVRFAGVISELRVDLGDRVRQGQSLAVVTVPGLGAQVDGALAADQAARREAEQRTDTAGRVATVAAQNRAAVSELEVVTARSAAATAQARTAAAAAETRRLRALMSDTRLTAPFDGVIVARSKDRGASVSAGDVVLEVARVDRLRLRVAVPEGQAGLVRLGAPLRVTLPSLGGRHLDVTISRFAPTLDPTTRMLAIEADVPNADMTLLAGVRAEARITDLAREGVLVVPSEAVLSEGSASVVYVADGAIARRRVLRIGYDNGVTAEVLEGLSAGDVVLLGGRGLLRDEAPVEVAR